LRVRSGDPKLAALERPTRPDVAALPRTHVVLRIVR